MSELKKIAVPGAAKPVNETMLHPAILTDQTITPTLRANFGNHA